MKVALLGPTGFVGSALLDEALPRGHTVTAIARHPEKLGHRDRLVPVSGDVYDTAYLAALIPGHDRRGQRPHPRIHDARSRCG